MLLFLPAVALSQIAPPKARQELSPPKIVVTQDSTKSSPENKPALDDSEIHRFSPRIESRTEPSATLGGMKLFDFRDRVFPELTIDIIDSLGKLYPVLKDYMLEVATTRGVLQIDSVERARKKLLDRAFSDLRLPGEMESRLRRNLAVYGTVENPMKPPPAPNQLNLFDVITAVSNLLRYLGVK
jgi:hypothetical protein